MKRMLINATQQEELRMAMVDGQLLYDLNIEAPASQRKKANIYLGKITRIEPSLEAAFVDYGADRHGFLPFKEISPEYFSKEAKNGGKLNIRDVLKEGQNIVVQVDKEERGNKGAALTTFVSLAGRFIVLKPNKARSGGVSRRIIGGDRDAARKSLNEIIVPDGMSVILRTAGIDRSAEELAWDLENLLTVWTAILNVVLERPAPFLIYRESDSVVRALRDYLTNEIGEILIDDEATYKDAYEHVQQTMPHNLKKLKHYEDPVPLFTRFQIESQIESAFAHTVHLPSGGSIVIDHTEALVSIDINSARATKGGDIEATALNTNLEAADEIARQLRIRDLGGLIVIDFIDMGPAKHQRDVENRLRDAVRQDRARVQIGKISRFGLLEMSRQRLRPSIGESSHMTCPRCSGFGNIRSVESLALAILRIVGEEARKERTAKVIAQLPVEVSTYLLNEKRDWVQALEDRNDTQVVLVANPLLETPHYEVRRVRDDQTDLPENTGVSYALVQAAPEPESPQAILERKAIEAPAVGMLKPSKPAPQRQEPEPPKRPGLFASVLAFFKGSTDDEQPAAGGRTSGDRQGRNRQASNARGSDGRGGRRKPAPKKAAARKSPAKKTGTKTTKKTDSRRKPAQKDGQQQPQQGQQRPEKDDENKTEATRPSRSRRSRGGRRRRRSPDSSEQAADNAQQANKAPEQDTPADAPAKKAPRRKAPAKDTAQKQDTETPREQAPQQPQAPEQTPTDKAPAGDKAGGPPRARTDAERAADSDGKPQPRQTRKPVGEKPAAQNGSGDQPQTRREAGPNAKPEQKAEPRPEAKSEPKPEPKSQPKPAADGGAGEKPKLLPWEQPSLPVAAKSVDTPKPAAAPKPEARSEPKPEARPEPKAGNPPPAPKLAEPGQD
ncbi:MAG: Rne/Rng family ribonuclease [Gammaproteobacteria bacterium]|nr:Rne/Rng family ribonuclease [Gammaproteobacteria bacterium]